MKVTFYAKLALAALCAQQTDAIEIDEDKFELDFAQLLANEIVSTEVAKTIQDELANKVQFGAETDAQAICDSDVSDSGESSVPDLDVSFMAEEGLPACFKASIGSDSDPDSGCDDGRT